jgi:hypothetical protein
MAIAMPRQTRSEALDILEHHISSLPHPHAAVGWRSFQTLYLRRGAATPNRRW